MAHSLPWAVAVEKAIIKTPFGVAELKPTAHYPYSIRLFKDIVSLHASGIQGSQS
jgi:hypothetical protein